MQQTIDLHRLKLTARKSWFENQRAFLLTLLLVSLLLMIWLGVYLSFQTPVLFKPENQIAYYFVGLIISGSLVANFLFAEFREKPKTIHYLMMPASVAEKLIVKIFFGIIVYLIGYTMIFYLIDMFMVYFANTIYGTSFPVINPFNLQHYKDPFFDNSSYNLFFIHFLIQAVFVGGSLYFRRYSFLKTFIFLSLGWITFLITPAVISFFLPDGHFYGSLTTYELIDYRGNKLIEMPVWFSHFFKAYFLLLVAPALFVVSYFRLKEKQLN